LLANLPSLDQDLQLKVLEVVDRELQANPTLLYQAINQQVKIHVNTARDLYQHKKQTQLEELLSSCDPAAAVMLNFEIALIS